MTNNIRILVYGINMAGTQCEPPGERAEPTAHVECAHAPTGNSRQQQVVVVVVVIPTVEDTDWCASAPWTYTGLPTDLLLFVLAHSSSRRLSLAPISLIGSQHDNPGEESQKHRSEKPARLGDVNFGYTFIRIEREAILGAFNFSDLRSPTNVLTHRVNFGYQAYKKVTLNFTGLLGRQLTTATSPEERLLKRLQVDATYKF